MTDHLSTIRQYVDEIRRHAWKISGDVEGCCDRIAEQCDTLEAERQRLTGLWEKELERATSAESESFSRLLEIHKLEAERLTPEEARYVLNRIAANARTTSYGGFMALVAKLERRAAEKPTSIRAMIDKEYA